MNARALLLVVAAVLSVAAPPAALGQAYEVRLKRAWASKYANRASIDATMDVRFTHKEANDIGDDGDDGDMHFSGVAKEVGLPFVAEIVNAGMPGQASAVATLKSHQASGQPLSIRGAWRLWFEHPATRQTQGGRNEFLPNNTNPDHSFEVHPVSRVAQSDLGRSFVMIPGYTAYSADIAFPYFDKQTITVKASRSGLSIRSKKLRYNYVQFRVSLTAPPTEIADGYIALGTIVSGDDQEAASGERRMIFLYGTDAAARIARARAGDQFTVLGIPRINLDALLALVSRNGTKQFEAALPYEMIVVGVR